MSVRTVVLDQFRQVALEEGVVLGPLSDEVPLLDLGLDSMCFAIIVSRLEATLGVDPFDADTGEAFPVNLGDFIRFCENAAP
jgi:hypothetical protein